MKTFKDYLAEVAKWRTHDAAHEYDDDTMVPAGKHSLDPLAIRQGASKTSSEKDPKSMAGKFGKKYAQKYGVPTKQLMKNIPLDDKNVDDPSERKNFKENVG